MLCAYWKNRAFQHYGEELVLELMYIIVIIIIIIAERHCDAIVVEQFPE